MKYLKYILLVAAVSFILADLSFLEESRPVPDSAENTSLAETASPEAESATTTVPRETIAETTSAPVTTAIPEITTTAETTTVPAETTVTTTAVPVETAPPMTEETVTVTATEKPAPSVTTADAIIKTAMEQLGKPYVLGQQSPQSGFDSSGLIQYVCKQNGIDFPRYTSGQSKQGTEISYRDLQAGDFMYLSTDNSDKISYCGIYLGGGKMLYSSTNQGAVVIIDVSSLYWEQHMITARRIV